MIAKGLFVSSVGAVLLVLVCVSAALCCPIHYVKPTGSDTNDGCSWATAKKTVQAGLNSAASGDEVWVAAGTYVERIILKSGGVSTAVSPAPRPRATSATGPRTSPCSTGTTGASWCSRPWARPRAR